MKRMQENKMTGRCLKWFFEGAVLLLLSTAAFSQTLAYKGLVSGWMTVNADTDTKPQIGLRCMPEFSLEKSLSPKYNLDVEFSLNAYGTGTINALDDVNTEGKLKPYRMWLRFSSAQFEARLGLQKINFGSASLLRPLMWFDRIDPRDPLQLTDGVYGLLMRYYFLDNTNIWVWGLYGNDEPKGWESMSSDRKSPELGGRIQIPLGKGEIAFSYHHREIDVKGLLQGPEPDNTRIPENRCALDGKWDIGIGIWFETSLFHQKTECLPYTWQRALNVGMDYTFNIGNGLNVIGEHFVLEASQNAFGSGETAKFSALALNYPLGLLDNITGILYY
ncbi:MAG: hypothetical protein U9Q97_02750, partial [Acidobacteriota bacterium]|nr:hypothetical protein [Acidobacteriota bacterium]